MYNFQSLLRMVSELLECLRETVSTVLLDSRMHPIVKGIMGGA